MVSIKIPMMLVLYGIFFVTMLPLLILAVTAFEKFLEGRLTSLGSSMLSLTIVGLTAAGALYLWLRIAKLLVKKKCGNGLS